MADLSRAVSEFVTQARVLCLRMRSSERTTLTAVDLHVLLAQLFLLNSEAKHLQQTSGSLASDNQDVIREYIRATEALLRLDAMSQGEQEAVGDMLVRLSEKLYPE